MPRQEVLQAALNEIGKGYAQYEYFFNKLKTSSWLKPLAERGYFKLGFPFWPSRHGQGTPIRGSGARSSFSSHDRCSVRSRFGR